MQEMNSLGKFVMTIIVVAMVLAIGLIILGEVKTSIGDDVPSTSVVENVTYVNGTYVQLAHTGVIRRSCSIVTNHTGGTINLTTSLTDWGYICTKADGVRINFIDNVSTNNITQPITVTYSYANGDAAYNATGTNITKLATIPTWIGILITVALAFIVLGYFYSRNN